MNKNQSNETEPAAAVACTDWLGSQWNSLPEWVRLAYHNDPTINRVMRECATLGKTKEETLWLLCAALYEQRNMWRDTALDLKQRMPLIVETPNYDYATA